MRHAAMFAALMVLAAPPAAAQTFPTRTVRIIVPYSVGLGPDVVMRAIAEKVQPKWQQSVVIENRPGASGIIALSEIRKVPADGHTLFVGDQGTLASHVHLYKQLPFDPARDVAPLTSVFRATFVIWVATGNRFATLRDLLAEARAHPGKVSFASLGPGHPSHLAVETFARAAGIEMLHVPFRDAGQMIAAVATGDVDFTVLSTNTASGMTKAGKWRGLAVGAKSRLRDAPSIPTLVEAGGPDVEMAPWAALVGVAGTPAPVLESIHRDVLAALHDPEVRGRIEGLGFEVLGSTPQGLAELMRSDSARLGELIRARNIRVE